MLTLVVVCLTASFASLLFTPLIVRAAIAYGLYDVPVDGRRVHKHPIPRLGGVAVFAALAVGLLAAALLRVVGVEFPDPHRDFVFGILFGGGILFAGGLIDDLRTLRPSAKLAIQCVAAAVVYAYGFRIEVLSLGPATELSLGIFSLPLTLVWIVGVTNAFNLIDGLDGLATGIALVALGTTLAVALALGNLEVALVCAVLLGALLGFLPYNFSPARIFLGDSGSLFIGFMLAVLSVHGSMKSATAVLALVPLSALALPLLDTSLAILRRWLRGVPLAGADARHIHHRLLAMGLSHRRAVLVMYLTAILIAVLGVSLAFAPAGEVLRIAVVGGGISFLLLLYGMRTLQYHEFAAAGAVLASGLFRVRRVIQDQIHASDVSDVIRRAETLEQVNAILQDNADNFGFLGMRVCTEGAVGHGGVPLVDQNGPRAWRLDYPVVCSDAQAGRCYVLRIWCSLMHGTRPYGAERVARILAPTIQGWLGSVHPAEVIPLISGSERQRAAVGPDPSSESAPSPRRKRVRKIWA